MNYLFIFYLNMKKKTLEEFLTRISKMKEELKNNDKEIQNLKEKYNKIFKVKEENIKLKQTHKLCQKENNAGNIEKLNQKQKGNEKGIKKLINENLEEIEENLSQKNKEINNQNPILSIKDLKKTKFFTLNSKVNINKENEIEEEMEVEDNNNIINIEELNKKEEIYISNFIEIIEKCNEFYEIIKEQKEIIENYKNYINEINQRINLYNEKLSISQYNIDNNNKNNKSQKTVDSIYKQIDDIVSIYMTQLDEIFFNIKNIFENNIEYLLNEINNLINIIGKKENKNNKNLINIIIGKIGHKIEEIQNICYIFEENKNYFINTNYNTEKEIQKLKDLYLKYEKETEKSKIIKNNKNKIKDNNLNNPKININPNINNYINNNIENISLKDTFLFEDINKEKNNNEYFLDEPKILRENWQETCYIYDDYDIHDIYYDIKAIGLTKNLCFTYCSHSFCYNTIIEVQSFYINDAPSNYKKENNYIVFKIKLLNGDSAKIHIIYKEMKDLKKLIKEELELRKIIRNDTYGLNKILAGQIAKFIIVLKGSFDIVNFDNYFLFKNENNTNENEYFWEGLVPNGGIHTNIMFSKREAIRPFKKISKIFLNYDIKNNTLKLPVEFIGGNNEILNITLFNPQTSNIILDEDNREYIIKYKNTKYKELEFIIEGKIKNKCNGEWLVDLSDEEIEKRFPEDDIKYKPNLNCIAKKIIEDFDKSNKNSRFKFLDYMKIGMWVNKNIKYDLKYIGKTDLNSIDIYNKRSGVCHHFTKLTNALLYSLGYKVIYVFGYYCKNNKEFHADSPHFWSLIKLDNKWYPFDSFYGIFTGKLPVTHIFGNFSRSSIKNKESYIVNIEQEK